MGGIHLDTEEEPRRGTSRANSVRFDETALHGHYAQESRSSSDFIPTRTGSVLGSHPMTERSSSHRSEGRQSLNGQSTRLDSLRIDTRPPSVPDSNPPGPPPSFFLLGPLPSIIRCWMDTNFSNESLLYAAVCTGSCQSFIQGKLASRLALDDRGELRSRSGKIRLDVFLPEAVFYQSFSRPSSPAPQLPVISVDFLIHDYPYLDDSLQVIIGSDALRLRNADILLSQDRLTLFDDRHNKIFVPLVRPENPNTYQNLITFPSCARSRRPLIGTDKCPSEPCTQNKAPDTLESQLMESSTLSVGKESMPSLDTEVSPGKYAPSARFQRLVVGEGHKRLENPIDHVLTATTPNTEMQEQDIFQDRRALDPPATTESTATTDSAGIWGPWRRDPGSSHRQNSSYSNVATPTIHQRSGRGRGMKILKPSRSSTSNRSTNDPNVISSDPNSLQPENITQRSIQAQSAQAGIASFSRKSFSSGLKSPTQATSNQSRPTNPVGSASAFGWLSSDDRLEGRTSTGA